jgi:hypothetical protein
VKNIRLIQLALSAVLSTKKPRLFQLADMQLHGGSSDLALVGNMLVRRPALALIAGVVRQLDQYQLAQRISDFGFHGLDH